MKFLTKVKVKVSDCITDGIATWTFVFLYSTTLISWVFLHSKGILTIDSSDFIKYNLFLSWLSGIQASIVLMSSKRQEDKNKQKLDYGIELDKRQLEMDEVETRRTANKLNIILRKIESLEDIVSMLEDDDEGA